MIIDDEHLKGEILASFTTAPDKEEISRLAGLVRNFTLGIGENELKALRNKFASDPNFGNEDDIKHKSLFEVFDNVMADSKMH